MPEPISSSVWSGLAPWYDEMLQRGSGPHQTALAALLSLVPDPPSGTVLDLACGQGLATRALAARGFPAVVGVDAAGPMLELARIRTDPGARIAWRLDDAEQLEQCATGGFDGVTCQLGLMDIADLDAALRSVRRVLKRGGWFSFVIGHPCFLAPHATTQIDADGREGRVVSRYFDSEFWRSGNPDGIRGRAGSHHRPLDAYLNALLDADLRLDRCLEPHADPLLAEQQPVYANVPIFFAARAIAV
jgi:ubiquinone/menaquinone biosynthesis C-methylase UbiE